MSQRFELVTQEEDEFAYSDWELKEGKRTWERFFAGKVDIRGKKVIDLGCGLGGKSAYYSTLGPAEIVGIDVLDENITKAKIYCAAKGFSLTSFQCADATHLPFEDALRGGLPEIPRFGAGARRSRTSRPRISRM